MNSKIRKDYESSKEGNLTLDLRLDALTTAVANLTAALQAQKFGSATDYTVFEADGTMVSVGKATTWEDLLPSSITVGTSGANIPAFTAYNGGLKAYEFVGTALMKELNIGFQIPHKIKPDSNIVLHIHTYVPNDASGGTVKFGCEFTWTNIHEVGAVTPTTVYTTSVIGANAGVQNNLPIEFTELNGVDKGISSMLMCRIFRDPTDAQDTLGSSVWIKSIDAHIEQDKLGSRLITSR